MPENPDPQGTIPASRNKLGFTLIQLMLVIAVVGVLASTACGCGAYSDYILRSKTSQAVAACSGAKARIAEFAAKNGRLPSSAAELGRPMQSDPNKYVRSLDMLGNSTIALRLQGEKEFEGQSILMRPSLDGANVKWECGTPDPGFVKYAPTECRNVLSTTP